LGTVVFKVFGQRERGAGKNRDATWFTKRRRAKRGNQSPAKAGTRNGTEEKKKKNALKTIFEKNWDSQKSKTAPMFGGGRSKENEKRKGQQRKIWGRKTRL